MKRSGSLRRVDKPKPWRDPKYVRVRQSTTLAAAWRFLVDWLGARRKSAGFARTLEAAKCKDLAD